MTDLTTAYLPHFTDADMDAMRVPPGLDGIGVFRPHDDGSGAIQTKVMMPPEAIARLVYGAVEMGHAVPSTLNGDERWGYVATVDLFTDDLGTIAHDLCAPTEAAWAWWVEQLDSAGAPTLYDLDDPAWRPATSAPSVPDGGAA